MNQYKAHLNTKQAIQKISVDSMTDTGNLKEITLTEDDLSKSMASLKPNSASGPDGIHAKLLIKCREELKNPMRIMWNKSIQEGVIPEQLKKGNITPIHKAGKKIVELNYRPVKQTSHWITRYSKKY